MVLMISLDMDRRVYYLLACRITSCSPMATRCGSPRIRPIIRCHDFLCDLGRSKLKCINPVGKQSSPAIVGHIESIIERRISSLLGESFVPIRVKRSYVMRFTIVVPTDDLNVLRLDYVDLLPAISPEIITYNPCY